MPRRYEFHVKKEQAGLRLDQAIAREIPALSRTLARKALSTGGVYVEKKRVKVASRLVREGQHVRVVVGEVMQAPPQTDLPPPLVIAYESESVLVVDKPSGMFSAATEESDQNHLLACLALERSGSQFFLVHRLDRPTSGLILVAKTQRAAAALSRDVQEHKVERLYGAILVGQCKDEHTEDSPLEGKPARTDFRVEERAESASLVTAELHTGRTHQVRLHAEAMGCPVAGDSKYGRSLSRHLPKRPPRLCLHAKQLSFRDPQTGDWCSLKSPFPQELRAYFEALKSTSPLASRHALLDRLEQT